MINVLVVDDQNLTHKIVETYLKSESEINIVGFARNGREAIEKIPVLRPNVILMDVEMPQMDGLSATKIVTRQFPQCKVLILTVHDNEQHLSQALKNGAKGYLLKTTTAQELKNAIYYINQGYFQLSVELTEKYLQRIVISKSEVEEISEINQRVNQLYQSIDAMEARLTDSSSDNSSEHLERKLEGMLQTEISMLSDRDSHLQFKVDRMKYNQERLKKNISYLFKFQIVNITIILLLFFFLVFKAFN